MWKWLDFLHCVTALYALMWQPNVIIKENFTDTLNHGKKLFIFWIIIRIKEQILSSLEASGPLVILLTLFLRSAISGSILLELIEV